MADHRKKFYHSAVAGISVAILIIGVICVVLGSGALYYAVTTICRGKSSWLNNHDYDYNYRHYGPTTTTTTTTEHPTTMPIVDCRYDGSKFAAGIWSGLMFIAMAIVGIIAARRKTTCMILSLLVLSVPCLIIAVTGTGFAIYSELDGSYWEYKTPRPVAMYIINAVLAFLIFVVIVLDIILFAFSCRAICCNKLDVHYTKLVKPDEESEQNTAAPQFSPYQWPGFAPMAPPQAMMQMAPSSTQQGTLSQTGFISAQPQNMMGQNIPQMFMVMPNGQGGYVPFQQPIQFGAQTGKSAAPMFVMQPMMVPNAAMPPNPAVAPNRTVTTNASVAAAEVTVTPATTTVNENVASTVQA